MSNLKKGGQNFVLSKHYESHQFQKDTSRICKQDYARI